MPQTSNSLTPTTQHKALRPQTQTRTQTTLHSTTTTSQDPTVITYYNPTPPMTDSYNQPIDARDLTTGLTAHPASPTSTDNGEATAQTMQSQRCAGSPSLSSEGPSHLPLFTRSSTTSTSNSDNLYTDPISKTNLYIAQGAFNKPRVHPRSRRDTRSISSGSSSGSSAGSQDQKEFKYYGRHGNQWLFNDFSVTHAVSKGWKRVFGKEGRGDWYEDRER